jgi:3-oxoadipate enol-lactonase
MTDRLHAVVDGSADLPAVVLGSSLGSTSAMWQPQVAGLSERFRVVRYDHLGHGASDVPEGPYTIDRLGNAVLALLDRLGLERVGYAGISLGGMVGIWLAENAPERIDRLALLCTSAYLSPEPWHERIAAVRAGGIRSIAEAVVGRWFTPEWALAHADEVGRFRAGLETTPQEGYVACCAAIASMDLRSGLGGIGVPTLVIGAAGDMAIPVDHQRAIAAAIPGARLQVLDHAAHVASVEQSEAVTAALLAHLGGG